MIWNGPWHNLPTDERTIYFERKEKKTLTRQPRGVYNFCSHWRKRRSRRMKKKKKKTRDESAKIKKWMLKRTCPCMYERGIDQKKGLKWNPEKNIAIQCNRASRRRSRHSNEESNKVPNVENAPCVLLLLWLFFVWINREKKTKMKMRRCEWSEFFVERRRDETSHSVMW